MTTRYPYPSSIPEAALILDKIQPDWYTKIDFKKMSAISCRDCILGQSIGSWTKIFELFDINQSIWDDKIFGERLDKDEWKKEVGLRIVAEYLGIDISKIEIFKHPEYGYGIIFGDYFYTGYNSIWKRPSYDAQVVFCFGLLSIAQTKLSKYLKDIADKKTALFAIPEPKVKKKEKEMTTLTFSEALNAMMEGKRCMLEGNTCTIFTMSNLIVYHKAIGGGNNVYKTSLNETAIIGGKWLVVDDNLVDFADIKEGEIFKKDGKLYLKIRLTTINGKNCNAVQSSLKEGAEFFSGVLVEKP